jgi:hypothetical protein
MVDVTATRAQAKGVTPTISREGEQCTAFTRASQNMAAVVVLLDTLPPPSIDGVDNLYAFFVFVSILINKSHNMDRQAPLYPGTRGIPKSWFEST